MSENTFWIIMNEEEFNKNSTIDKNTNDSIENIKASLIQKFNKFKEMIAKMFNKIIEIFKGKTIHQDIVVPEDKANTKVKIKRSTLNLIVYSSTIISVIVGGLAILNCKNHDKLKEYGEKVKGVYEKFLKDTTEIEIPFKDLAAKINKPLINKIGNLTSAIKTSAEKIGLNINNLSNNGIKTECMDILMTMNEAYDKEGYEKFKKRTETVTRSVGFMSVFIGFELIIRISKYFLLPLCSVLVLYNWMANLVYENM